MPFTLPRPPMQSSPEPGPTRPGHRLRLGTRALMRTRHGFRLAREVSRYGVEQRLWWLVPVVTLIVVFAIAVTTTTTALPVAVYTLF